jgi:hypothetical protein
MEYKHRPVDQKIKQSNVEIYKKFVESRKYYSNEVSLTCPYCTEETHHSDEGWACDNAECAQVSMYCEKCSHWMNLLNWGDRLENGDCVSATEPSANVGKPFTPANESGDWYVDDQTTFYWQCENCKFEEATECD